MYNRDLFFSLVRDELFHGSLTQQQVDGMSVILAVWEHQTTSDDDRKLAYMLATSFHETAYKMWPITEMGSQSYLQGKEYFPYVGRGFVQLTWEDNYRRASEELGLIDDRDLVEHMELALDSLIATRVLFKGMQSGWFTGKKLDQYFNSDTDDPKNARDIINPGDDEDLIVGYHDKFLEALIRSEVAAPIATEAPAVFVNVQAPPSVEIMVHINGVEYGS